MSVNHYIPRLSTTLTDGLCKWFEEFEVELYPNQHHHHHVHERKKMMKRKKADPFDIDAFRYGDELYIVY